MRVMNERVSVMVPAGTYVLGDPCYVIEGDDWDAVLTNSNYFGNPIGFARGVAMLGFHTAYGDGCYQGSDGYSYGVDAGLIGLVPLSLAEKHSGFADSDHRIIEFTNETLCTNENGVMNFGSIRIDTTEEVLYEDDNENVWDDE